MSPELATFWACVCASTWYWQVYRIVSKWKLCLVFRNLVLLHF